MATERKRTTQRGSQALRAARFALASPSIGSIACRGTSDVRAFSGLTSLLGARHPWMSRKKSAMRWRKRP
jgi:hypothetical protein